MLTNFNRENIFMLIDIYNCFHVIILKIKIVYRKKSDQNNLNTINNVLIILNLIITSLKE